MGSNLAGYLVWVGDLAGAAEAARSVFAALAREPDHPFVATALEHVGLVRALEGDLASAAALEGFAEATIRRSGLQREATEKKTYERLIALLHEGLGPDELERLIAEGAALGPEAAIALAIQDAGSA